MARDFRQCVSTSMHPALSGKQPHFRQEVRSTLIQAFLDPGCLQGHQFKAVPLKQGPEAAG
jgi:hypothetical protein